MKPSILSDERDSLRKFQALPIGTVFVWREIVVVKISKNRSLLVKDISDCNDETGRIDNHSKEGYTEFLEVAPKQIQEFFK